MSIYILYIFFFTYICINKIICFPFRGYNTGCPLAAPSKGHLAVYVCVQFMMEKKFITSVYRFVFESGYIFPISGDHGKKEAKEKRKKYIKTIFSIT